MEILIYVNLSLTYRNKHVCN